MVLQHPVWTARTLPQKPRRFGERRSCFNPPDPQSCLKQARIVNKEARKSLESSPVKTGFGETCYQEAERMRRKEPSPSPPRPRFYPQKGTPVGPCGTLIIATALSIPAFKTRLRHYLWPPAGPKRATPPKNYTPVGFSGFGCIVF